MKRFKFAAVLAALLMTSAGALADEGDTSTTPASQQQQVDTPKPNNVGVKQPIVTPRMDVVFTIDATGSMGDEIEVIKKEVWNIAKQMMAGKPAPDLRFGLVLYRDTSDAQLVEVTPLTRDVEAVYQALMAAQATGGGDKPEHIGAELHASLDLAWDKDPGVKRVIYLVSDAGASQRGELTVSSALKRAKNMDVSINAIGCSGLQPPERAELNKIASNTGGGFEALTYYAVVEGDDGKKRSVVYYDGEMYESEGEISDDEWKAGGDKVIAKRKMKKAASRTRSKAHAAPKRNNLDSVVSDDLKDNAGKMGISF